MSENYLNVMIYSQKGFNMKFKKSFLFGAMMAASLVLAACNDKEKAPEPQKTNVEAPANPEQAQINQAIIETAKRFQEAVNIGVTNVNLSEDGKTYSISYSINNLTDKPISTLQWATIYKDEGKAFYAANIPAIGFKKTIAPQGVENITLSSEEENVLSQMREHLKPGANIQIEIIGTLVQFADGSVISVETPAK